MWAVCFDWASLYALQGIEPLSHAEGGRMGRVALERHGSRAHGSRRKHGYSVSMATGTTTDVHPRENCMGGQKGVTFQGTPYNNQRTLINFKLKL